MRRSLITGMCSDDLPPSGSEGTIPWRGAQSLYERRMQIDEKNNKKIA